MQIIKTYKYELKPNNKQEELLRKHAGCARFVYNWGLDKKIKTYQQTGRFPSWMELHKEINRLKKTQYPWMYEVSKCAPQEALRDLDNAFKKFLRKQAGFPKFKKKGKDDSFRLTGVIKVFPEHVQLPRIGKIRLKEKTDKFSGRILHATVKREIDRWYVCLTVQTQIPEIERNDREMIGIDIGIANFVTLSDGTKVQSPKPLQRYLKILQKRAKAYSRKKKGSKNQVKAAIRLAKLHRKIRNIRLDFLHKLSTNLAKTRRVIVVEMLKVSRMIRNRYLSRAIADEGWGTFLRMLEYKTRWYGSLLVEAPFNFASTKTCSLCGWKKEKMSLSCRTFICEKCGNVLDRDVNAARNLLLYGTASSAGTWTEMSKKPVETPLTAEQEKSWSTSYGSLKQEAFIGCNKS